mgnify:CR=1 FL=1
MSLLIVGSVGYDSIRTPFGAKEDVLGGSAIYAGISSSFFAPVRLVAVVGEDFKDEHKRLLIDRNIDVHGLETMKGKTFRWSGEYGKNFNEASTLKTELNVFENFNPQLPDPYKDSQFVFLGNINPKLQQRVITQIPNPKFVAMDTMNFWIKNELDELKQTFAMVDMLIVNEGEAKALTGKMHVRDVGESLILMGLKFIIIKRGEYGAMLFSKDSAFQILAFPTKNLVDPTGAGDTFAGGLLGYLAHSQSIDIDEIKKGIAVGTVLASFAVESFSTERLLQLNFFDIKDRMAQLKRMSAYGRIF